MRHSGELAQKEKKIRLAMGSRWRGKRLLVPQRWSTPKVLTHNKNASRAVKAASEIPKIDKINPSVPTATTKNVYPSDGKKSANNRVRRQTAKYRSLRVGRCYEDWGAKTGDNLSRAKTTN